MIIARLQSAAMTRVNMPEEERKDFYVYADEFQNFATTSFATILSEARKYRLNLIITHQYIDQLPEEVRNAVFGNVGTTIAFTIGPYDSQIIAQQFAPVLSPEDLVALEKHHIYLKLMIDGMESRPFSAATLPPIARHEGHKAAIIAASRAKYAKPLSEVEERISKWTLKKFEVGVDDVALKNMIRARESGKEPTPAAEDHQEIESRLAAASAESTIAPPSPNKDQAALTGDASQKQQASSPSEHPTTAEHSRNQQPVDQPASQSSLSTSGQYTVIAHRSNRPHQRVKHPQPHQATKIVHGVPGGVGHTDKVEHIATSGSSGEIILHTPSGVDHTT